MSYSVFFNWKMNPQTLHQAQELFLESQKLCASSPHNFFIAPPSIFLSDLIKLQNSANLHLLSQEISDKAGGSFTGQISSEMVKSLGIKATIIGHSETREFLNVDDEKVAQKVSAAQENLLDVVLCVGEKSGQSFEGEIRNQLVEGLRFFQKNRTKLFIAYEPVWAIGSGKVPLVEDINKAVDYIQKVCQEIGLKDRDYQIIYGGSVSADNILDLKKARVDGFLIGGASLKIDQLSEIIGSL